MRRMKLIFTTKQKSLSCKKAQQESGQTLHELLIASSFLAIAISGFSKGIISSNQVTHQDSLRKAAESRIADDLESIVKRRFYTFRCRQGPCRAETEENARSLMYYNRNNSDDKQDFISHCNARDLASELLLENENNITTGEQTIETGNSSLLSRQDIAITRTISLDESNHNQAIIEYEAVKDSEVLATIKTTLVPNAVHWCS